MPPIKKIFLVTVSFFTVALAAPVAIYAQDDKAAQIAASADSGTADRADKDMRKVIEALGKLGGKPIETLTPAEARLQPTPSDAVLEVLRDKDKDIQKMMDKMEVTAQDMTYPAAETQLPVRIYMPDDIDDNDRPLPVVVYYHGGGFVIADIDTYDATPRSIAKLAKAIVVSPEYRHAPEDKFPAAHNDAFAAYQWVVANAATWGGDPANVAVMGESAGGNLAANVAIAARDNKLQAPVHMVLVYPVAGTSTDTVSYQENVNAKPLNKAMMEWFVGHAVSTDADKQDTRLNLLGGNLRGLPEATIITAEIDPLRSDGKSLYDKLISAGVNSEYKEYKGVTHEFFGMAFVVDKAKDAQNYAVKRLKAAFDPQD